MGLRSWIRDPGSGKNLFRIPDLESRGQKAPDPGTGSATLILVPYVTVQHFGRFTCPVPWHIYSRRNFFDKTTEHRRCRMSYPLLNLLPTDEKELLVFES
jgi:hypothetical protein